MSNFDSSKALRDMQELADETELGLYIPKRFRKGYFSEDTKKRYVEYLRREIVFLQNKLKRTH